MKNLYLKGWGSWPSCPPPPYHSSGSPVIEKAIQKGCSHRWCIETIIGLWTSPFSSQPFQSCKRSKGTKVLWSIFGFFAASCAPVWLRPHVAPSLWPDGSQLIAKSHSWRCVTVQALAEWWLPSDRPNEAQRKSFSEKNGLLLDSSQFPVTRFFWLAYNSKINLSSNFSLFAAFTTTLPMNLPNLLLWCVKEQTCSVQDYIWARQSFPGGD